MAAEAMAYTLADALGGKALPPWTENAIQFPWWPYAMAVLCAIGFFISMFTAISSRTLNNATIVLLFVELWLMFVTVAAYVAPWVHFNVELSG